MTNLVAERNARTNVSLVFGLIALLFFFFGSGFISYRNIQTLNRNTELVLHTHDVILNVNNLFSLVKDAETGQRGFILTGDSKYLQPYSQSIAVIGDKLNTVERLTADNPAQQERLKSLRVHINTKLAELAETIELRKSKGFEAALAMITTDQGKNEMDLVRNLINDMQQEEVGLRTRRLEEMNNAYYTALVSGILTAAVGIILSIIVYYILRRAANNRLIQHWLQAGEVGLANAMLGDQRLDQLGDNILGFLAKYFGAQAGAFFVSSGKHYDRVATYGVPNASDTPSEFSFGDGLLGQTAKDGKPVLLKDIPDGYLTIGSALGKSKPRYLLISPGIVDGDRANSVLELGFINPLDELSLKLLDQMSGLIGIAVRSANYRTNLQNLLEETQRQSEELQTQSEELRVSNEELEEQSRALKESQARLEQQQVELEQSNSQLEEQTQILEIQRDDINQAKESLQQKAEELERASKYKSDFLANMSHELRTPLNSSLILAKLLADNAQGNLTEEQIRFAETIQSSGNDLLTLINDILDLSKIEAGHMELHTEKLQISRVTKDLLRMFEPVARQKGLAFNINIDKKAPKYIVSDQQRLEQILKNLLSNAIKFTEKGEIELNITQSENGKVSFAVNDSGIGISEEQHKAIFEAFRQADGNVNRKYGGTGLGLSISRELSRLLGGSISLASQIGKGSTFKLTIPENYDASLVETRQPLPAMQNESPKLKEKSKAKTIHRSVAALEDDRETLTSNNRIILVVEDDVNFAGILKNLIHELNFQCLIAHTAEEGLIMAAQYEPSAVILDIGLPDHSGLSVLDRLKRDARTRHIPVHVISASDDSQRALFLGAIGYALKPVKREQIVEVLKQFESRLISRMRHVLIVEDDPVQRESLKKLLGTQDVQTTAVGTANECMEKLKDTVFDCMVLDLSLPDASGYELLETLSKQDAYSFPPVIVYTGHDLSNEEEQRLRRYSKSIIIKGAKSPERLLDEVTLFLHQVVSELSPEQQKLLKKARNRDEILENRRILIVEDDVRNVYSLTNILEPCGANVQIARNGREALDILKQSTGNPKKAIDLVLMDVMMPEMDGMTATREIRKNPEWKKLPIIMLTAKAMKDDQERCLDAGANDYMSKPLDVEKLLSLVRVWMPR